MDEAEWLASADPRQLLNAAEGKASFRKFRLFSCACARAVWPCLDELDHQATCAGEKAADGEIADTELREHVERIWARIGQPILNEEADVLLFAGYSDWVAISTVDRIISDREAWRNADRAARNAIAMCPEKGQWDAPLIPGVALRPAAGFAAEIKLLLSGCARCIFGNPFRPLTLDPSWLTPTVRAIAQVIYKEKRFKCLPILADALEDAGCADPQMLEHCRGQGPHCRGCFSTDLLLGKS